LRRRRKRCGGATGRRQDAPVDRILRSTRDIDVNLSG
jgi:hypothetical protein